MYLIKLISKVEGSQIPIVANEVAEILGYAPEKFERILSHGRTDIGKTEELEKAQEIARAFSKAGVDVIVAPG